MTGDGVQPTGLNVVVIGAGIIGLASAVALLRAGHHVRVIDREAPGAGASFGNAGSISVGSVAPNAHPRILLHLPRWLLDPLGPVSIHPRYLPQALPWLARRLYASCHRDTLIRTAAALAPLLRESVTAYRALLEPRSYERLIRVCGQMLVSTRPPSDRESLAIRLRREHGIAQRVLTAGEIRELEPALSGAFRSGVLIEDSGHTIDTKGVIDALVEQIAQAGGQIEHGEAIDFDTGAGAHLEVITGTARIRCDRAIVATGAWSSALAARLGDRVSLESERGYHATLTNPGVVLSRPVGHMERHFFATSLAAGLRVAGTAEIAGLDAPPAYQRAKALLHHAQAMLPGLRTSQVSYWMGHRPATPDALPVIGRARRDPRIVYAFGHGHLGLTLAPATARLVTELISEQQPSLDLHPYRASRFR